MRIHRWALALVLFAADAWALHESEVGVVDWHKHLIGVPLAVSPSTVPTFRRHPQVEGDIILAATGSNVLAALNATDGSVVWRHLFEREDPILTYHADDEIAVTLSGPGGANLRSFNLSNGHIIQEEQLHPIKEGILNEPMFLGSAIAIGFGNTSDIFTLTNSGTISRIDRLTGEVVWKGSAPDQAALTLYVKVVPHGETTYGIGLTKSYASYTLHVEAMSTKTGEALALSSMDIPSSIKNALTDVHVLATPAGVSVVWLEDGIVKRVPLDPTLKAKPLVLKGVAFSKLLDVGVGSHGYMVAIKTDGLARVLKLDADDDKSSMKSVWEFANSNDPKEVGAVFTGGLDTEGRVYVARAYWSNEHQKGGANIFTPHLMSGQGLVSSFLFPFDTQTHGTITSLALRPSNPGGSTVRAVLVVTTSTGVVQAWSGAEELWRREEALASVNVAEFVELPEAVAGEEGGVGGVGREGGGDFPQYAMNFVKRFATGSYASPSSSPAPSTLTAPVNASAPLTRDAFGFRQVIVAASDTYGKIFGIDSSNGNILWTRLMGLGWAAETGGTIRPVRLFVLRGVTDVVDGEEGRAEVLIITQRRSDNSLVDTVLFHIDPFTGEDISGQQLDAGAVAPGTLAGIDLISGPLLDAFLLPLPAPASTKVAVMFDEFLQVHLYPSTASTQAAFARLAPKLHFPLLAGVPERPNEKRVLGHRLDLNTEVSEKYVAHLTWALRFAPGEDVLRSVPAVRGPVASLGKVLGNRTTLYKYINPRMFVVLTSIPPPPSSSPLPSTASCGIYVVDSAKGSVLYSTRVPAPGGGGGTCDVEAVLVENWLVYHYWEPEYGVYQAKGWRVVSVEMYEGGKGDEKTRSSEISGFDEGSLDLHFYEESYLFPEGITAIAATSTKFGISSKDIIVATKNHKIQSFSRRMLDPRRPHRKPTSEEQEEFLVQYDPVLPNDQRRVLSHGYEVANTVRIITSPSLLESTSLVLAYGLDMFLTRTAPSSTFDVLSENFNKAQLVLTVSGLALAIVITKPMVRRKKLRERWYQ